MQYEYIYTGTQLTQMIVTTTVDDENPTTETLYFTYETSGPMTVTYNGETYYYAANLQGDVVAILDDSGDAVVEYTYDAWGKLLTTSGDLATTLGAANPLTYRGYVYDRETTFYYLLSRYYSPNIERFLNADNALAGIGSTVKGYNMFAYCFGNPTNMSDATGHWPQWLKDTWEAIKEFFSPDSNSTSGEYEDGIFRGSGSVTAGYSEVNGRLQVNSKDGKTNGMLGAFAKASMVNASGEVGVGNDNVSLSFKGVGDALTATAQAGIQYKDGFGVAAKAKAAVLSGRATTELELFGWQIEFGVSGDILSVGADAMFGVFPNEGFVAKADVGLGLFGAGFVFRVKPAQ